MIHKTDNIDEIVTLLINGELVVLKDEHRAEVQKRLRKIKSNCTEVLRQINDKNF